MLTPAAPARSPCPRGLSEISEEDEADVYLSLAEQTTSRRNYAALSLPSGHVLEIHGLGVLAASVKSPSRATEPAFILRNPDGSIEDSGTLDVGLP